jgi:hypothetical protein
MAWSDAYRFSVQYPNVAAGFERHAKPLLPERVLDVVMDVVPAPGLVLISIPTVRLLRPQDV